DAESSKSKRRLWGNAGSAPISPERRRGLRRVLGTEWIRLGERVGQSALLQDGSAQPQNETMFDWNDLKAFLAVARGGSTLAASKALGVNQTTVARRIESLEHDLGFKLFERGQTGSRLTESGQGLIAEAENVERAAI